MALWTPAQISTAVWLSDTGSSAGTWPDSSGNGRDFTQGTASAQPAIISSGLNGLQVRRFDGNDRLVCADRAILRNKPGGTLFVVFSTDTTAAGEGGLFSYYSASSTNLFYAGRNGSAITYGGRRLSANSGDFTTFGSISSSTFYILTTQQRWSDAEKEAWYLPSTTNLDSSFQTAGNSENLDSQFDPSLGAIANGSSFFDGDMAEMILLDYSATTSERQIIEGYLAWKWGLEGDLPAGHPYEFAAPTIGTNDNRRRRYAGGYGL